MLLFTRNASLRESAIVLTAYFYRINEGISSVFLDKSVQTTLVLGLDPKQAYDERHLHNGTGRRLMARTVPPAVCDGCGALGCPFVMQISYLLGAYAGRDFHTPAS